MINKLYISTSDYNYERSNINSVLVHRHNINYIIGKTNAVDCHSSIQDLGCENISLACKNANEIVLVDIDEDIGITNNDCFSYGRLFNELTRHTDKVKNFNWKKNFNYLKNIRADNNPILWTAGCSFTAGAGIDYKDRWGTLLSGYLNLQEVTLANSGTSIFWSADQILRSDIREGDTVVWGLTSVARVEVAKSWNFNSSITVANYLTTEKEHQYWNMDYFESETQVLQALRTILQVINFCKKVKANLYLANMLDISWLAVALKDFKNFIDLTQNLTIDGNDIKFIDLGSDNLHPGPLQHQFYAEQIYNLIKESNHGKTI